MHLVVAVVAGTRSISLLSWALFHFAAAAAAEAALEEAAPFGAATPEEGVGPDIDLDEEEEALPFLEAPDPEPP